MEPVIYDFNVRGDERGSLIAIEEQRDIRFPFAVYITYLAPNRALFADCMPIASCSR